MHDGVNGRNLATNNYKHVDTLVQGRIPFEGRRMDKGRVDQLVDQLLFLKRESNNNFFFLKKQLVYQLVYHRSVTHFPTRACSVHAPLITMTDMCDITYCASASVWKMLHHYIGKYPGLQKRQPAVEFKNATFIFHVHNVTGVLRWFPCTAVGPGNRRISKHNNKYVLIACRLL